MLVSALGTSRRLKPEEGVETIESESRITLEIRTRRQTENSEENVSDRSSSAKSHELDRRTACTERGKENVD